MTLEVRAIEVPIGLWGPLWPRLTPHDWDLWGPIADDPREQVRRLCESGWGEPLHGARAELVQQQSAPS
jgi:hypothetical protein